MPQFNPQIEKFNPRTPEGAPDFTSASRGYGENNAIGTLFKGLGGAVIEGFNAVDQNNVQNIKNEAFDQTEQIRSLFGVDAATDRAAGTDLDPGPTAMAGSKEQISRLTQAYQAGSIRESHYLGQLNAVVKNLRARYPGYDEQIDNTIQSITGLNPANSIVSALRQEALADLESGDKATQRRYQFIKENLAELYRADPNFDPADDSVPLETLMSNAGQIKAEDSRINAITSKMTMQSKSGELDYDTLVRNSRDIVGSVTNQLLNTGFAAAGKGNLDTQIAKWRETGTVPSPEEQAMLLNTAAQKKLEIEELVMKTMGDTWFDVKESDRKDILASATTRIDMLVDAINNGDYGMVAANSKFVSASQDLGQRQILEKYPDALKMSGIAKLYGPEAFGIWLGTESNLNDFSKALGLGIYSEIGDPNQPPPPVNDTLTNLAKEKGVQPELFTALLNNTKETIISPETNPIFAEKSVEWMFGKTPLDLSLFPAEKRTDVFSTLASPEVTARVKALSADKPELWSNYSKWVYMNFNTRYKELGASIAQTPKQWIDLMDFWVSDTGEVGATPLPFDKIPESAMKYFEGDYTSADTAQTVINARFQELNQALTAMKPVLEADGKDYNEAIGVLMQQLGIPIDDLLDDTGADETGNVIKGEDPKIQGMNSVAGIQLASFTGESITDARAFVADAEGTDRGRGYDEVLGYGAWGGGDVNVTEMTINEAAALGDEIRKTSGLAGGPVGRYQIVPATLRSLVKKMGLTGDELYDKEMQDKMFDVLAKARGSEPSELRKEWDSLRRRTDAEISQFFGGEAAGPFEKQSSREPEYMSRQTADLNENMGPIPYKEWSQKADSPESQLDAIQNEIKDKNTYMSYNGYMKPELKPYLDSAKKLFKKVLTKWLDKDPKVIKEMNRMLAEYGQKPPPVGENLNNSDARELFYIIAYQIADMAQEEDIPEKTKESLRAWGNDVAGRPAFNLNFILED